MCQKSTKLKGFTRWTHLGGSYSALPKGALGLAICVQFSKFGYETRRVGGNIHEDCSMLTERDIEKRHKIDKVSGNIKGNVNCTYTFVAGRSTSKLYGKVF